MNCIWGSSPADIYIGGNRSTWSIASLFHYDGNSWTPVTFATVYDFGNIFAMTGFGPNDIYTVGARFDTGTDSSVIMHFGRSQWVEQHVTNGRALLSVWGSSPSDVWTGGHAGTLFHSDGATWSRVTVDPRLDVKSISGMASNDIYLLGTHVNDDVNYYLNYTVLYHYDGAKWRIIDSMSVASSQFGTRFGEAKLGYIGGTLYSVGYGIYAMHSDGWQKVLNTDYAIQWLYASSQSTAFAVGQGSLIYYFDGQSWEQLTNVVGSGHSLRGAWATATDAFIVGSNDLQTDRTLVLHGR